ncbi:NADH-quinone oxidoreductase subunit NuoE [Ignavibacteriales bacterium]
MHSTETGQAARKFAKVCEILEKYNYKSEKLIPVLQAVQEEYRYLPEDVLAFIATTLDISPARIYGVATFYSHFALAPKGKFVIKVCDGTACHVKGSLPLIDEIRKTLNLKQGKETTDDLLFTLETVSCLGACGIAPVVVVNDEVHSLMTPGKTTVMIEEIMSKEKMNDE